jgi:hypothetical protein
MEFFGNGIMIWSNRWFCSMPKIIKVKHEDLWDDSDQTIFIN